MDGGPRRRAASHLTRVVRWVGLDRNPLRRDVDRLETAVLAALLVVMAVTVALTPFAVRQALHRGAAAEHAQSATRHRTVAVLMESAAEVDAVTPGVSSVVMTRAWWRTPAGVRAEGRLPVAPAARAGTRVDIWLNDRGERVPAPQTRVDTVLVAGTMGLMLPAGAGIALITLMGVVRGVLNRRRYGRWESEWARVAPIWSRRP